MFAEQAGGVIAVMPEIVLWLAVLLMLNVMAGIQEVIVLAKTTRNFFTCMRCLLKNFQQTSFIKKQKK